jgi:hypothetical protein
VSPTAPLPARHPARLGRSCLTARPCVEKMRGLASATLERLQPTRWRAANSPCGRARLPGRPETVERCRISWPTISRS